MASGSFKCHFNALVWLCGTYFEEILLGLKEKKKKKERADKSE